MRPRVPGDRSEWQKVTGRRLLLRKATAGLAQLAQFEGDFANFADSPANPINGLAAVCGRIGRVVATKAIPFCRGV